MRSVPAPSAAPVSPLAALLGKLPAFPGSLLFAGALTVALADRLPPDVLEALRGRPLRIQVQDTGIVFDFLWRGDAFAPCRGGAAAALTISASALDFVALARRQEDPDTLFFSRRLAMEGDTELGLLVKNSLDAIDGPLLRLDRRTFSILARFISRLAA